MDSDDRHPPAAGIVEVTLSQRWKLTRGASLTGDGVRFEVWAPLAKSVSVRLHDGSSDRALEGDPRGVYSGEIAGVRAGADYCFVLDGKDPIPDPVSRHQPRGVHGPSRIVDPSDFEWTDADFRAPALGELVIYEIHVGTFDAEGTFEGIEPRLQELKQLGVTAIELMPIAQFPGARNWGYDGVLLYAVQNSYGGPAALRRLVNAAHRAGIAVILDVVYNHLGPEGNILGKVGPYFTGKYHTPWGGAVNYDDAGSDEVRRYVIDNALYWITEYHIDGLRLDAVHGIFDFGAVHVLAELAEAVRSEARAIGRSAFVIGESDLNDPRVVQPASEHGWGLDAQWADDLHHALHAQLTGETNGYYADFGSVRDIARALESPYVYKGRYSVHRKRRHGAPPDGIRRERFVVAIQNHDQVGNRAAGDRLAAIVPMASCRLAAATILLSGYVPLLFMGEEYGETNPFPYFVSHTDEQLLEAVRQGRTREFASFGWAGDVPDPASEETFRSARLDWEKRCVGQHRALRELYAELLTLRREEPALGAGGEAPVVTCDESNGWVRAVRSHSERDSAIALNFSDRACEVPPADGEWQVALSTDDARFGGSTDDVASLARGRSWMVPAKSALVLRAGTAR